MKIAINTEARKALVSHLAQHGPTTTLQMLKLGLNPQAANAMYAEGKLEIGERGYQLPTRPDPGICGCGCGGYPNPKHEEKALADYWEAWPTIPATPWLASRLWCVRWPLPVSGGVRLVPSAIPEGAGDAKPAILPRSRHANSQANLGRDVLATGRGTKPRKRSKRSRKKATL